MSNFDMPFDDDPRISAQILASAFTQNQSIRITSRSPRRNIDIILEHSNDHNSEDQITEASILFVVLKGSLPDQTWNALCSLIYRDVQAARDELQRTLEQHVRSKPKRDSGGGLLDDDGAFEIKEDTDFPPLE